MSFFADKSFDSDAPLGTPDNPNRDIFTLANVVTMLRLVLTFIFLYLFVNHANRAMAVTIYAIAASTDWLDGQIARKTQTVSWFGKILDPICDRALLFTGVLGLVLRGELPAWIAYFIIGRDVYLAIGAKILQHWRKRPLDVVYIGKVATAFLMTGFTLMLLGVPVIPGFGWMQSTDFPLLNGQSGPLGLIFIYIGCCFSLATAIDYTYIGITIARKA